MSVFDVILRFTFSSFAPPPSSAAKEISQRLNHWNDGRYPFDVEMMHKGLQSMVQWAFDRSGGTYITEDGGRALAVVERGDGAVLSEELAGKWRVLYHYDGPYVLGAVLSEELAGKWRVLYHYDGPYVLGTILFDDEAKARAWASEFTRFPIVVEAEKATAVLAILNAEVLR